MRFINKINKILLENYPLIWNTRLLWMILVNIIIYIFFFVFGYSSVDNLKDLQENLNLESFFHSSSGVYYNILISIISIIVWIVFLFRNNAFKSNYYLKKGLLFKQFCIMLFVFFISSSHFFSFKKGLVLKIKTLYTWEEVKKDIDTFNKLALFTIQTQNEYDIDNKQYPEPFPLNVVFSNKNLDNVDTTKVYITEGDNKYQFFKFNEELYQKDKSKYPNLDYIYNRSNFKYRIVKDVTEYKELLNPSLLNYSSMKFEISSDSLAKVSLVSYYQSILEDRDEEKIKEILSKGIELANKYELSHNLTIKNWLPLVYNPPNYLLEELIGFSDPTEDNINSYQSFKFKDAKDSGVPFSKTLYFDFGDLDYFFRNVYFSYYPKFDYGLFCLILGLSFVLAILLFVYRTTTLKSLLFSFLVSLLLLVVIIWMMSSEPFINRGSGLYKYREYIYVLTITSLVTLTAIVSYLRRWQRIIIHVSWSLSIFAVPLFFLFLCLSYIKYLTSNIYNFDKVLYDENKFIKFFNLFDFWLVLLITLIAVFIYSIYIRKLKAIPK